MKVLCVGSLNLDYTYQVDHFVRPGETLAARARSVHCGGKGLNQSIAAAKAGLQVWHAGLVGTGGAPLLDALQRYGVDTGLIRALDQPCGHTVIQVTEAGENCILLYGGTNTCLTESFVDETLCRFAPGDVLLLQNEVNGIPYLIRQAVRRGLQRRPHGAGGGGLPAGTALLAGHQRGGGRRPGGNPGARGHSGPSGPALPRYPAAAHAGRRGLRLPRRRGDLVLRRFSGASGGHHRSGGHLSGLLSGRAARRRSHTGSPPALLRRQRPVHPAPADAIPLLEEVRAALAAGSLGEMGKGASL